MTWSANIRFDMTSDSRSQTGEISDSVGTVSGSNTNDSNAVTRGIGSSTAIFSIISVGENWNNTSGEVSVDNGVIEG